MQTVAYFRILGLLAALFGLSNASPALAQELTQVDCTIPGMYQVYVHWMLSPEQSSQLTDMSFVNRIIVPSPKIALSRCGAARLATAQVVNITVGPGRSAGDAIEYLSANFNLKAQQFMVNNHVLQQNRQQEQEAQRKNAEQQRLAAIVAEKQAIRQNFISTNGVQAFANQQALQANVFLYKDKVVGVPTSFAQMTSPSEALFGQMVITNVPSAEFTSPGQPLVLAVKISGLKAIQTLGTNLNVPYGSYVGVYKCKQTNCADFF